MKRLLFTTVFAFIGIFTLQAQWFLGGSASAAINKEAKSFSVAPDVGYSISNTPISIACAIEYGGNFSKDEGYTQTLTVSPYLRYDICNVGKRFTFFGDFVTDFDALNFSFFEIGVAPGISFKITERWSTEFVLGFLGYQWKNAETATQTLAIDLRLTTNFLKFYYSFP